MSAPHAVEAYSFESIFDLGKIAPLVGGAPTLLKTQLVSRLPGDGVVYAFDFGALVFFRVPRAEVDRVVRAVSAAHPSEPHAPLREELLVEIDADKAVTVSFDRILVPELSEPIMEVIARVLAQSVAIDYYEEDVQAVLARISEIAGEVGKKGRPRGRTRDLVRFVGAATASQVEIAGAIALLDKPDISWEDEAADRLHDKLRAHLEITERYRALETKLMLVRESMQLFLELVAGRRTLVLETTVVLLIFVEIVLGILRGH